MERTFLDELAVTCNVRRSLALVGKSAASLYYRRRTVPGFAAAWDAALNEGYAKLEAAMISRALSEETGEAHEGDPALKPMGPGDMISVPGLAGDWRVARVTFEGMVDRRC